MAQSEAEAAAEQKFRHFDLDGNGLIEQEELVALLRHLDHRLWSEKKINQLLQYVDANNDGAVDIKEFVKWTFQTNPHEASTEETLMAAYFRGAIDTADELSAIRAAAENAAAKAKAAGGLAGDVAKAVGEAARKAGASAEAAAALSGAAAAKEVRSLGGSVHDAAMAARNAALLQGASEEVAIKAERAAKGDDTAQRTERLLRTASGNSRQAAAAKTQNPVRHTMPVISLQPNAEGPPPSAYGRRSDADTKVVAAKIRQFDLNGDGVIERKELKQVLRKLNPDMWTEKELNRLFRYLDANEDDQIDFDEFVKWCFDADQASAAGFLGKLQKTVAEMEVPPDNAAPTT
eukprot:TRINITY_DN29254_c0_g1_i1.p1 TRINITY_DN29254_c0_g1~~TRINITY_DN29254_c0_g1_i1.p1  ORF type:complete len:348 (+),score=103.23 TRINITY_DN29254_c0_g1_i1:148-1191(+)